MTLPRTVAEVLRYGEYSKSGEFVYDRPFLWGSRRTGPDLARVGGKYPDAWHTQHMAAPTSMIPKSNMPAYALLTQTPLDPAYIRRCMDVLDFPYTPAEIAALNGKTEMDAMVAYLQKLGTGIPLSAGPSRRSRKAGSRAQARRRATVSRVSLKRLRPSSPG